MKTNKLLQVSTLNALMMGDYYGAKTVEEILKETDTGIGTFDGLNGEAIFYKGKAYNGQATGKVIEMHKEDKVPFSCTAKFDYKVEALPVIFDSIEQFKKDLEAHLPSKNYFYMIVMDGKFNVRVRSCFKQEEPYEPLYKVACDQREFEYHDVEGVVVGIYSPNYVEGMNLPGWHIHFLSKDFKLGGHILNVSSNNALVKINKLDTWEVLMPENKNFAEWNLKEDLKEKTEAVEGNTKK